MPFDGLRDFLSLLEANNQLARVHVNVDADSYEVSAVLDRLQKLNGKAVVFEKVGTSEIPLCANVLGTFKRIALALETNENLVFKEWTRRKKLTWLPPEEVSQGPCQEVTIPEEEADLGRYPILKWNPFDAGPYITLGVLISKDPETGVQNAGIYRLMVQGKRQLGVNLLKGRHALVHLEKAEASGKPLQVAVAIGLDPVLVLAAASDLNYGEDEFALAGALRGEPVKVVKCKTVDINVPASSEIVFEGIIPPKVRVLEGPFGESSGYYGKRLPRPIFRIQAVTQRKKPIYQATYTGKRPKEEHYISALGYYSVDSTTRGSFSLGNSRYLFRAALRKAQSEFTLDKIVLPSETLKAVRSKWGSYQVE